jgi:hypothetical protein
LAEHNVSLLSICYLSGARRGAAAADAGGRSSSGPPTSSSAIELRDLCLVHSEVASDLVQDSAANLLGVRASIAEDDDSLHAPIGS